MSGELDNRSSTQLRSRGEEIECECRQFEAAWFAWRGGEPPEIDVYLRNVGNDSDPDRDLLCKLVGIDMESRWRNAGARNPSVESTLAAKKTGRLPWRPRLADYAAQYPSLGSPDEWSAALLCQEYYVGRLNGRLLPRYLAGVYNLREVRGMQ